MAAGTVKWFNPNEVSVSFGPMTGRAMCSQDGR